MRTKTIGLVALLLIAGCSDSPMGPEDFNINGTWSAPLSGAYFSVTLSESKGGVTGNAILLDTALQVTGRREGAVLTLDFTAPSFVPFTFSGRIVDRATITGTVHGSGFVNDPLTLTRN